MTTGQRYWSKRLGFSKVTVKDIYSDVTVWRAFHGKISLAKVMKWPAGTGKRYTIYSCHVGWRISLEHHKDRSYGHTL